MDSQKKQKVMIAVLAVAILGAGTFFWINSGSDNKGPAMTTGGPIVRRERDQSANAEDSGPKRRESNAPRRSQEQAPTIKRRERQEQTTNIERRRSKRDTGRKQKKQEIKPLG